MLNHLWLGLLLVGVTAAAVTGQTRAAVDAALKASETAVTLAIGLVGVMSLWLGIMRLADRSGLVQILARALRPALSRLFPEVPEGHPAMASMMLNIAANMLGLTNAATPFGLRAMRDLDRLNPHPGTASNAMCTFLAINTGSVQLIPASAIAVLATSGSVNPTAIVGSTLVATAFTSAVGLTTCKLLERLPRFRLPQAPAAPTPTGPATIPAEGASSADAPPTADPAVTSPAPAALGWPARLALVALLLGTVALVALTAFPDLAGRALDPAQAGRPGWVRVLDAISLAAIPFLLAFFPLYAALRRVPVYEEFVEGAKEGFQVAVRIIPYLVGMLVAIGLLRGSGAIEAVSNALRDPLAALGFPVELLPISLIRPLSGSASLAAFSDIVKTHGADSLLARMAGTLFGSTETTFYVVAVYFGSVAVRRVRHAVWAGLAADLAGVVAAVAVCRWMFA